MEDAKGTKEAKLLLLVAVSQMAVRGQGPKRK